MARCCAVLMCPLKSLTSVVCISQRGVLACAGADLIALPGGASKSQVFGISLSKCLRHDAERNRRVPAAPSSESNLLDALSLSQSANISRRRMTSRPNADQLYDEHYCSTLLQVPHVVRICCRHLKTDGNDRPYDTIA